MVGKEIEKLYNQLLSDKLDDLVNQSISSKLCEENNQLFLKKCEEQDFTITSALWTYIFEHATAPKLDRSQLLDMFDHLPDNYKRRILWFASPSFDEKHINQWETVWKNSVNEIIKLSDLRAIQWKASEESNFLDFKDSLSNMLNRDLSSKAGSNLFQFLADMFTYKDTKNGNVFTMGKKIIVIGDYINQLNETIKKSPDIKEIRIYAKKLLVLNCDLEFLKGKNLVLVGSTFVIKQPCVIDVSGASLDKTLREKAASAKTIGEDGSPGTDGLAGESSGNVGIFMENIINPQLLKIKLCGGDGQGGQDGGDGADGKHGARTDHTVLEKTLAPQYTSIWRNSSGLLQDYCPPGFKKTWWMKSSKFIYMQYESDDGRKIDWSVSGDNGWFYNIYDIYMVVWGPEGTNGGDGGKNGLGGEGGNKGEFMAMSKFSEKDFTGLFQVEAQRGNDGEVGKCGKPGKPGTHGNDIALIDRSRGKNNHKKIIGGGGRSKLTKKYYTGDTDNARLNGYFLYETKDKYPYVKFEELELQEIASTSESTERMVDERKSESRTVSKQTISKADVLEEFNNQYGGEEIDFFESDTTVTKETYEEKEVLEEEIQEEVTVMRTQIEDFASHEINMRKDRAKPEDLYALIDAVLSHNAPLHELVKLMDDLLSIPLDMSKISPEKIALLLSKMKVYEQDAKIPLLVKHVTLANDPQYFNNLKTLIEDKICLSLVDLTIDTTQKVTDNIVVTDGIISDVSACPLNDELKEYDSSEFREKLVDYLTEQVIKYGADGELIIALSDVVNYLKDFHGVLEKYKAEVDWSDVGAVIDHLQKFLSEKEKQETLEKEEVTAETGVEFMETTTDSTELPTEEVTNDETGKEKEKYFDSTKFLKQSYKWIKGKISKNSMQDIEEILKKSELKQCFEKLRYYLKNRPQLVERFVFEKGQFEPLIVGSTCFSIIRTYFYAKQILDFNCRMFRYLDRFHNCPTTRTDWWEKDENSIDVKKLTELVKQKEQSNNPYKVPDKLLTDQLREYGLKSSAYRLLVANTENINLQVYSESGFAKVRLIENNNPEKKKKVIMILHPSGSVHSIEDNRPVRQIRNMLTTGKLNIPLKYSQKADLTTFITPAVQNEVKEWQKAVTVATGNENFLRFLRRLFEVRGFSYSLHELQFLLNTIIDLVCNYEINLENLCSRILEPHGTLLDISLYLRILVATGNTCPPFEQLMDQLKTIKNGRLRALFGAKLQGSTLKREYLDMLIMMLSHADSCFSDLEQDPFSKWIDIAKVQQWNNYEQLNDKYGTSGYFFILLDSTSRKEGEKIMAIVDKLRKGQHFFTYEKMLSRLAYAIHYKDINFNEKYITCLQKLLTESSQIAEKAHKSASTRERITLISDEREQRTRLATIRSKFPKEWEIVFPTIERTCDQLITLTKERASEEISREGLVEQIKNVVSEEETTERVKTLSIRLQAMERTYKQLAMLAKKWASKEISRESLMKQIENILSEEETTERVKKFRTRLQTIERTWKQLSFKKKGASEKISGESLMKQTENIPSEKETIERMKTWKIRLNMIEQAYKQLTTLTKKWASEEMSGEILKKQIENILSNEEATERVNALRTCLETIERTCEQLATLEKELISDKVIKESLVGQIINILNEEKPVEKVKILSTRLQTIERICKQLITLAKERVSEKISRESFMKQIEDILSEEERTNRMKVLRTFLQTIEGTCEQPTTSAKEKTSEEESLMKQIENTLSEEETIAREKSLRTCLQMIDGNLNKLTGKTLRSTQKIAILASYLHGKNILAQVNTGEGKTYIIASLAVLIILMSDKKESAWVDIITSSSVLAQRDCEEMQEFYKSFNISASHNCDENVNNRMDSYKKHIVYGDIPRFERDYLLQNFYKKNILGERQLEKTASIVDEVDSMLLDNGSNMLYLSHNVPGLDLLESLFIFMHKEIYTKLEQSEEKVESMTASLRKAVLSDLYGLITKDNIMMNTEDKKQIPLVWRLLIKHKIIGREGVLMSTCTKTMQEFGKELVEKIGSCIANRVLAMISIVLHRKREIQVPEYLKPFILLHLDEFVDNAFKGLFLKHNDEYVVDLDRTKRSSELHPVVTIIDKGTGTDLSTSQWSEGLHQFLQLKHGCRITPLSLKAVFVSNVSYLKRYKKIHGFSGTLGSDEESKSLRELYNADVIRIPTYKPKLFNENVPILATERSEWVKAVFDEVLNQIKADRSVLLICKSIGELEKLHEKLTEYAVQQSNNSAMYFEEAVLYKREFDEFDLEKTKGLQPKQLIISTNLAGRGTDIKLSKELVNNGGLHVIISFLPENKRIEEQAYGRAARCGEPGSGQIITLIDNNSIGAKNVFQLKQFRDNVELHRLKSLKQYYDFHTDVEETCLKRFQNHCSQALAAIYEARGSALPSIIQIIYFALLDEWAMWLDFQVDRIKQCEQRANEGDKQNIIKEAEKFLDNHPIPKKISDDDLENILEIVSWINVSQPLISIALVLIDKKKYEKALEVLNRVEQRFPDYLAEVSYYKGVLYQVGAKAFKKFNQNDIEFEKWYTYQGVLRRAGYVAKEVENTVYTAMQHIISLEDADGDMVEHDENRLEKAINTFIRARSEFLRKIKMCKQRSNIVIKLQQSTAKNLLSDGYKAQQEEMIAALEAIVGNIGDIIGHTVKFTDFDLSTDEYNCGLARSVDYEKLGIISPVVLTKHLTLSMLQDVAQNHCLPVTVLYHCLRSIQEDPSIPSYEGRKIIQLERLSELPLPSVTGFWTALQEAGCFLKETTYFAFKKTFKKIPEMKFKRVEIKLGPFDLTRTDKDLDEYYYYECNDKYIGDFTIEQAILQAIKSGDAHVEMVAVLNLPFVQTLPLLNKFDYITEKILSSELGIGLEEAQFIINKLIKMKVLKKVIAVDENKLKKLQDEQEKLGGKDHNDKKKWETHEIFLSIYVLVSEIDLSAFSKTIQEPMELVLNRHFTYGYILKSIKASMSQMSETEHIRHSIMLPEDPYKDLYQDLINSGILIDSRVTEEMNDIYDDNSDKAIPEEIYDKLKKKAPWIKLNDCKLKNTGDFLMEKRVPTSPEIHKILSNGLRQVAYIEEPDKIRRWTWYYAIFAAVVIIGAIVAVCFLGPIALVLGTIILAVPGTTLFVMSLITKNRKAFQKYDATEYEEYTTLITNYRTAVEVAKKEIAVDQIATEVKEYTDKAKLILRKYVLAHCFLKPLGTIGFEKELQKLIHSSPFLQHFKKCVECYIMNQMRRLLRNFTISRGTDSTEEKTKKETSKIFTTISQRYFSVVVSFSTTIIEDFKKFLLRKGEKLPDSSKFNGTLSTYLQKNVVEENYLNDIDSSQDELSAQLKEVCNEVIDEVYGTKVEDLINQFINAKRSENISERGNLVPDGKSLKDKSAAYSEERLTLNERSNFMNKDLSNIFLKICFQNTEQSPGHLSLVAHMVEYNYPLGTHCGEIIFKATWLVLKDIKANVKKIKFQLKRKKEIAYEYTIFDDNSENEKAFSIVIELKNNCFFVADEESDFSSDGCSGLYESLTTSIEEFASHFSMGSDDYQAALSKRVSSLPNEFLPYGKTRETWHRNEKLIPPVPF